MASNVTIGRRWAYTADALMYASFIIIVVASGGLVVTDNGYWGVLYWLAGGFLLVSFGAASRAWYWFDRGVQDEIEGRLDG